MFCYCMSVIGDVAAAYTHIFCYCMSVIGDVAAAYTQTLHFTASEQ